MKQILRNGFGLLILTVILTLFGAQASAADTETETADRNLLAAALSFSAYNDDFSKLARQQLTEGGWSFQSVEVKEKKAEGRFFLASHARPDGTPVYALVFPGTERSSDIKVDLRIRRVPFGGHNVREFDAVSKEGETLTSPLVHKGFNDYVEAALFTEKLDECGGRTAGEFIADILKENPQAHLLVTGHSLGGAAAVLAAARFSDLGAQPEQLEVVTFGAPAVGNEAFAERYRHRFTQDRIVMAGDPVHKSLQALSRNFVQFGTRSIWEQRYSERFEHEMGVYLDMAMHNYYDARGREADFAPLLMTPKPVTGGIYLARPCITLDFQTTRDEPYVRAAMHDTLLASYTPVTGAALHIPRQQIFDEAREQGCRFVLFQQLVGKRIRDNKDSVQRLTLMEELYDVSDTLLNVQSVSATTKNLTPLETAVYLQQQAKEGRKDYLDPDRSAREAAAAKEAADNAYVQSIVRRMHQGQ